MTNQRLLDFYRSTQCGVLARRQLVEAGLDDDDIARMLRRRELCRVHRGVYVDHTGPLARRQREWAAVLAAWPAALSHESAVPGLTSDRIHLAIGLHRSVAPMRGVRLHATAGFDERVDRSSAPPRVRPHHAVVDVMTDRIRAGDVAGAYAALTTATFRGTSADRVERALASRARVPGRALIAGMLEDLRTGACSVLERGYLQQVERAHGLPAADRQRASTATGRRTVQDVRYERFGLVVELDGRGFHDNPRARDADARRDLAELAVDDARSARVTYGLVFNEACRTAGWIAQVLRRGGWTGALRRCPECP
ncbi:hypothetical protein [Nocardioides montaniterrae]